MSPRDSDNGLKKHLKTQLNLINEHENLEMSTTAVSLPVESLETTTTLFILNRRTGFVWLFNNSNTTTPNCFILSYLIYIYPVNLYQEKFISQLDILVTQKLYFYVLQMYHQQIQTRIICPPSYNGSPYLPSRTKSKGLPSSFTMSPCEWQSYLTNKLFHSFHSMMGLQERRHAHKPFIFLGIVIFALEFLRALQRHHSKSQRQVLCRCKGLKSSLSQASTTVSSSKFIINLLALKMKPSTVLYAFNPNRDRQISEFLASQGYTVRPK